MTNSFDSVSDLLRRLGVPIGPSEAHGMIVGLLCAQPSSIAKSRWFTEILDAAGMAAKSVQSSASDVRSLDALFTETVESLNDSDLGFTPLLPEDDASLMVRLAALSEFCAGFNYGVGIGIGGERGASLPDDSKELLGDFQAIEGADLSDADDSDEESLVELAEFVRVGVLLIHEELQPVAPTGQQVH